MKKTNYSALDGQILHTFLMILEESSVSKAAERLDVTQSAVSHALAKLRLIMGDPLFVRSGQGLVPTEQAKSLRDPVQKTINSLKNLTEKTNFDPLSADMRFLIAANDMPRDMIFPQLLQYTREKKIRLALEFMPSGVPSLELLRQAKTQMVITPLPPDGPDIFQRRLFPGRMMCFFDGAVRSAPKSWKKYCASDHLAVKFARGRTSFQVLRNVDQSQIRKPTVTVSNFNALAGFLRGSNLLVTEMDLMKYGPLKGFDFAPLPFKSDPVNIYMVWHERDNNDSAHIWLRRSIEKISDQIIANITSKDALE